MWCPDAPPSPRRWPLAWFTVHVGVVPARPGTGVARARYNRDSGRLIDASEVLATLPIHANKDRGTPGTPWFQPKRINIAQRVALNICVGVDAAIEPDGIGLGIEPPRREPT